MKRKKTIGNDLELIQSDSMSCLYEFTKGMAPMENQMNSSFPESGHSATTFFSYFFNETVTNDSYNR